MKHKAGGPNDNWRHLGREVSFSFFSVLSFNNDITQPPHDTPHAHSVFAQALCRRHKLLLAEWQQVMFLATADITTNRDDASKRNVNENDVACSLPVQWHPHRLAQNRMNEC